jgi:hypothetical protein
MLIYSMSVSVDGFITDREGEFGWSAPRRPLKSPVTHRAPDIRAVLSRFEGFWTFTRDF